MAWNVVARVHQRSRRRFIKVGKGLMDLILNIRSLTILVRMVDADNVVCKPICLNFLNLIHWSPYICQVWPWNVCSRIGYVIIIWLIQIVWRSKYILGVLVATTGLWRSRRCLCNSNCSRLNFFKLRFVLCLLNFRINLWIWRFIEIRYLCLNPCRNWADWSLQRRRDLVIPHIAVFAFNNPTWS